MHQTPAVVKGASLIGKIVRAIKPVKTVNTATRTARVADETKTIATGLPNADTNPAAEAAAWQGQGAYPGVDDWTNVVLPKGTRVHAGEPGVSGFFTSNSAAASVGQDATALNQGLQIAPRNGTYRPGLTEFELMRDVTVARSTALANPQFGPGGLEQFYIPGWESAMTPIVSRIMK